jgi:predicted peptidase
MPRLAGLPCWVFHGLDDEAVRVDESLRLVNALNELGAPVRLTVYPKAGHIEAWQNAYDNPRLWEWLFAQRRE